MGTDEGGRRVGAGSLPPHTETIVRFCHFSLAVDRKVKYGNSAGKVTLKLLQTQLKLWSARCLRSEWRFFFMRLRLNFHTKEVQISLRLSLNLWTFWSLPSLSFSPCTAGFSHTDWALAELPSPDNHEGNYRKLHSKIEAKVVFWQITGWRMEKYGQQFPGNPNTRYLVSTTLSTHH